MLRLAGRIIRIGVMDDAVFAGERNEAFAASADWARQTLANIPGSLR
jgi:hypothetical protein